MLDPAIAAQLDELQVRYVSALDEHDMRGWADCFADEASYVCTTRENEEQHLPVALMMDDNRERIEDRMDTRFCELAKSDNEGRDKVQHRLDQLTLAVGRICGRLNIRPGEPEI